MIKVLIVLAIILCTLLFVKEIEDCCGGNDEIETLGLWPTSRSNMKEKVINAIKHKINYVEKIEKEGKYYKDYSLEHDLKAIINMCNYLLKELEKKKEITEKDDIYGIY